MKICIKCKIERELVEFYKSKNKDGLQNSCRECHSKKGKEYYNKNSKQIIQKTKDYAKNNRDKVNRRSKQWQQNNPLSRRKTHLKRMYNLTLEQYNNLLVKQNFVCEICKGQETLKTRGKLKPLAVDHNHITNKIRGLLCQKCNTSVGHLNIDLGPNLLNSALKYYEKYK